MQGRAHRVAKLVDRLIEPSMALFESRGRVIWLLDDSGASLEQYRAAFEGRERSQPGVQFATSDAANTRLARLSIERQGRVVGHVGLGWDGDTDDLPDADLIDDVAQTVADVLMVDDHRRRSVDIADLVPHAIVLETASGERLLTNDKFDTYVEHASESDDESLRSIIGIDPSDLTNGEVRRDVRSVQTAHGERVFEITTQLYQDWTLGDDAIMAVMTDLTDIERSQEELRLKQRQLQMANAELERSNDELEQFAYVASHDLQEPLRMVSSFLSLLVEEYGEQLGEEALEYVDFAVDGARRMKEMVNELLAFSRVRTRHEPLQTVDVNRIVEDAVEEIRQNHPDAEVQFDVDELPELRGRPGQLRRVFANLFINAVRYSGRPDVTVQVRVREVGDSWEFAVIDDGQGVPEQQRDRVFEIFVRGVRDAEDEGSGIGLAVCATVAAKHGGRIWVEDADTGGAAFKFTISRELDDG